MSSLLSGLAVCAVMLCATADERHVRTASAGDCPRCAIGCRNKADADALQRAFGQSRERGWQLYALMSGMDKGRSRILGYWYTSCPLLLPGIVLHNSPYVHQIPVGEYPPMFRVQWQDFPNASDDSPEPMPEGSVVLTDSSK